MLGLQRQEKETHALEGRVQEDMVQMHRRGKSRRGTTEHGEVVGDAPA